MNKEQFIIATAIILFVAFLMGWFANWLINRFLRVAQSEMGELDLMAKQLHEAEEQRDEAVQYYQHREAEMASKLAQTEAELRAAMDAVRDTRTEAEELRAAIERQNAGHG